MKNSWREPSETNGAARALVVIQDGVGDRPLPALGDQTPLEAADKPCMDGLIRRGAAGLMEVVERGGEVATHTGHLALFGQDPERSEYQRGPMEASGVGFHLLAGDVALRFNFATVDESMQIVDRRAGRIRRESARLIESLERIRLPAPVQLFFLPATEHRGVLVMRGEDVSPHVTDSDPGSLNSHREVLPVRPTMGGRAALRTAGWLNEVIRQSHSILEAHPVNQARRRRGRLPANIILTRGAGTSQRFVDLPQNTGLRIACVSGEATVLGLARLSGMTTVRGEGMTANLDTDLDEKAARVESCLASHDLVYLHLKGCDIAGHDRSPEKKKAFIERTDEMLCRLLERLRGRYRLHLALLGDHCTLSKTGEHSDDPVPIFLEGEGIAADSVARYGERSCAEGRLGLISPEAVMDLLLEGLVHVPQV